MDKEKPNWRKAYRVLKYIRLKIIYKKLDLLRKYRQQDAHILRENVVAKNPITAAQSEHFRLVPKALEWETVLNNGKLIEAMHKLTLKQQKVLWLALVWDFSQKEIGRILNINNSAVCRIQRRAIDRLRKLKKDDYGS